MNQARRWETMLNRMFLMMMLGGVLSVTEVSHAVPITFYFTGTVTSVDDDHHYLDGTVAPGTAFSGSYTFESSTPFDPQAGAYAFVASPEVVMNLHMGDYSLFEPLSSIRVVNGPTDWYEVYSSHFTLAGLSAFMMMEFIDYGGSLLASNALPMSPPDLGLADSRWFMLDLGLKDASIRGDVISITPEPQAAGLLLLGGLLAARMRKQKY